MKKNDTESLDFVGYKIPLHPAWIKPGTKNLSAITNRSRSTKKQLSIPKTFLRKNPAGIFEF
jgi:hypothetical protein